MEVSSVFAHFSLAFSAHRKATICFLAFIQKKIFAPSEAEQLKFGFCAKHS
jgi:hypothetical protein